MAVEAAVPGLAVAADLPPGVAGQRPGRRPRGDHAPGAPGHGVRRAGRTAADHRALHHRASALLAYAVFGPSRVLVLGPDSSLGPMIAATLLPLVVADGDPEQAVAYASVLALMVGAITTLAGVFRLGFVADLLSRPTQIGYMNGLALTILVGQLPKLFGFSVDADTLLGEMAGFVEQPRRRCDGRHRPSRWVSRASR